MLRGDSLRQTTIDNFNALRGNTNVSNAKGERFTNCLSNPSLCVFFCGHFPPKHQKKKMSILRKMLHYTPSHYENNLSSKVAPHGPKGGLCGKILP